jgi:hypothetical protein
VISIIAGANISASPGVGNVTIAVTGTVPTATTATNLSGGLATEIPFQSAPNITTFSPNLTYNDGTNTLNVGAALPGVISASTGQTLDISSDISLTFTTNSLSRLTINQNGSFTVNGSAGTSGQVLTSNGSSSSPTWTNPAVISFNTRVGAITLTSLDVTTALGYTPGSGSGTVTSVDMSVPSFLSISGNPITTAGTLTVTYSGTALPIPNGGTGQTTAQAAIDALAGSVTSAQYLRGNGSNVVMSTIQASDVPTLNQSTTGTAAGLSTTLVVGSGGTGVTSLTTNGVLYGGATVGATAAGTTGQILIGNTSAAPSWSSKVQVTTAGSVAAGTGSLATNATDGFFYIPTCAGVPTGVPTTISGFAPMVIDSTDNSMYIYVGGSWRQVFPAAYS